MSISADEDAAHSRVDHGSLGVDAVLVIANQLRQRIIQPKVRLTTQRHGWTSKPF